MKVIGILLNSLSVFWIVMGTWFVIDTWKPEYQASTLSTAIAFVLFFLLPGVLGLLFGSWMLRSAKRRRMLKVNTNGETSERSLSEARSVYEAESDEDGRMSYEDRMRKQYESDSDSGRYPTDEPNIDLEKPFPENTVYRTNTVRSKARASGLVVAVCGSCGSRKTIRAGTEAQCEYCGATIEQT